MRADRPHQPALLRTCTQIRAEGTPIFFNKNAFTLPIKGYESSLGLKWCDIARPHLKDTKMSRIGWEREPGTETWVDLKTWLHRTFLGLVPRYSPTYYPIGVDEYAEEMFDVLDELMDKSWERLGALIEEHKCALDDGEIPLFDNPGSDC